MDHPPQTDQAIVALACAGNPEHFGDLVLRYQERIYRFVRSIVWDSEAARDVTQVAFEKAFVALNAYDKNRPFKPWLFGIARNEAFSQLRAQRARPSVPFAALIDHTAEGAENQREPDVRDDAPDPAAQLAHKETTARVHAALARLDPRYRAVLTLFYLEDMPYSEIARTLSLRLNTVRTHLRRGKAALAEALAQEQRNFAARRRVAETAP